MSFARNDATPPRTFGSQAARASAWLRGLANALVPLVPAGVLIAYITADAVLLARSGAPLAAWRNWLTIPAALLAGGLGWHAITRAGTDEMPPPRSLPALAAANLIALIFLLARPPSLYPGHAVIALVFAAAAALTLSSCIQSIREGDGIGLESNWGGFGGGLGGWRMTRAASLALLVVVLAGAAMAALQFGTTDTAQVGPATAPADAKPEAK